MTIRILNGDCRVRLRDIPAASVQIAVTSPPYYGLRAYGTPPLIWGGDADCPHEFSAERGFCARCGAWRGHLGLEPDFHLYIEHMVEVFDEVWRVLRDDGTLWLNLGDCYATGAGAANSLGGLAETSGKPGTDGRPVAWGYRDAARGGARRPAMGKHADLEGEIEEVPPNRLPQPGMRPKSKMMIPARVAIAMQDRGWILRQEIIWHKLNPMPESTYDRPTTAHEQLFLFAKSAKTLLWRHRQHGWTHTKPAPDYIWRRRATREEVTTEPAIAADWVRVNLWRGHDYFYDAETIMEPSSPDSHARAARGRSDNHKWADGGPGDQTIASGAPSAGSIYRRAGPNSRENVDRDPEPRKAGVTPKAAMEAGQRGEGPKSKQNESFSEALGRADLVPYRNKRSVWSIATGAFRGAHFATFPTDLVRPCIIAGSRPGDTVLDPFGGAGTTAMVADQEQRHAISVELNPNYVAMQENRLRGDSPLFTEIERAAE